ncbi:MAG: hypothetical protein IT254_12150 [Chitinophagaceae bacterium]|nr:hypothetical protein [Bacteroidota bacterium]MCC6259067.1 hypothetical protein [Chitinophagaceae bacterium]MCW5916529.1 hypothetical protein [Ferruginibacter sp.]
MKKFTFLTLLFCSFFIFSNAQIENPVRWAYSAKKIADKTYEIHLTASIDGNWHIYAQDAGEGPEPTSFTFTANPLVKREGKVLEIGKKESAFDPNFNSTLKFFSNKVDFVQKVKVKTSASTVVSGTITYMVCNDKKCLPPKDVPFSVKLNSK